MRGIVANIRAARAAVVSSRARAIKNGNAANIKAPIKVKKIKSLRGKNVIRLCASKIPKNIRAAIPYLMKAKDKGSLSSIIKRVNTTVIPPKEVERDAQKTPKRVVFKLFMGVCGFKFIKR